MRADTPGGGGARDPSAACCRQSRLVWTDGVGRATNVIDRQRRGWVWPAASSRRGSWDPGIRDGLSRPPCQRLGRHRGHRGLRTSPATGHCAACHHRASSSIRRTQARQACYGRDHPVNHSEVTDPDRRTPGEARCAARPAAGQAQLAGGGVPRAAVRPCSGLRIPDTVSARARAQSGFRANSCIASLGDRLCVDPALAAPLVHLKQEHPTGSAAITCGGALGAPPRL